jgi:signal transduction histidine kinase
MSYLAENSKTSQPSDVKEYVDKYSMSIHTPDQQWRYLLALIVMLAALAGFLMVKATSSYKSGSEFHATIEMTGSIIALIAGFAFIVRFYTLGSRFYLFVGLAFLVSGAEDVVHGLLSFEQIHGFTGLPTTSLEQFIPATYVTGRILLGALLLAAVLTRRDIKESMSPKHETIWITSTIIAITMCITATAFELPLPKLMYPESSISRPVDFMSSVLLLIVFLLFLRKYYYERSLLTWWILFSIGVHFLGQLMISFSKELYDIFFDIAHVYKILAYAIPLLGFCLYQIATINERKQAENVMENLNKELEATVAKLRLSNRELKDFAYVVAHDLKTPLRGISTLAHWLKNDYRERIGDEGKEQIDLLVSRTNRMHDLIEGILQYSRVEHGEQKRVKIDLNKLIEDVTEMICPPENIKITVKSWLPVVECYQTNITQIFQNLLSNAIKYMDKSEGRIEIDCVVEDDFWKFSVFDNGPGIEEKYFEKIFMIFETLSPDYENESTGIGLTVIKKIIELEGGKIWVESEVGKGSTFFFMLPKQQRVITEEQYQTSISD